MCCTYKTNLSKTWLVAPSGAVYKPEECGMDGNGNGWCAGEAVPAEFFMKDKDLNAKQADKNGKKKKKKPKVKSFLLENNVKYVLLPQHGTNR